MLAVSSSSVLCSPQTSRTVVLTAFLASAVSEEEIHYPVAWQLGGRSGTLPVGAARSQLGVLPEQQFARQTRCSSLYSILFCFYSSCLCRLADKLFFNMPWPSSVRERGQELGFGQDASSVSWRCGDAAGLCFCSPGVHVLPKITCAAQNCACWARFSLLPGLALKTVVKPFPSLLMKGFTACCNEPLKRKTGGKSPVYSTPPS